MSDPGDLDTYVRVVYAERILFNEVFLKDSSIHAAQRKKAEEFLAAAGKHPSAFGSIAKEMGLESVPMTLSAATGARRADRKERGAPAGPSGWNGSDSPTPSPSRSCPRPAPN
ncbi:MAG: hypothetical protein ACYDAX_08975 [Desulfobacteria bacterium]